MEDQSLITLKSSLSSVPAKALNFRSRVKISKNLNVKQIFETKNGNLRDYRGLAEFMGFEYNDIKSFERYDDPTLKILETWETQPDAMLDKLIFYLEEMERFDVIQELKPLLDNDVKNYLEKKRKSPEIPLQVPEVSSGPVNVHSENDLQFFTSDDVKNGKPTYYDAYVSYADEDIDNVLLLANFLESADIGLKLFIHTRDMLAGCTELVTNIELIKNRCRRMLIVLTSNYLRSPACEFQTSFAASLAIDLQRRMLIPVIIEPCEIPSILKYLTKIDFTKSGNNNWVYKNLVESLLPENEIPKAFTLVEKNSLGGTVPPKLQYHAEKVPAITFPPSTKQLLHSTDNCNSENGTIYIAPTSERKNKIKILKEDSNDYVSRALKWKFQLISQLKRANTSSSDYSASSSSSATSGFHSQSRNTFENLESYPNDTAL